MPTPRLKIAAETSWTIPDQSREASDARIARRVFAVLDAAFARGAEDRRKRAARTELQPDADVCSKPSARAFRSAGRPEGGSLPTDCTSGTVEAKRAAAMHWTNKAAAA